MDGEGTPLTDWITLPELPSADQEQNTHSQEKNME